MVNFGLYHTDFTTSGKLMLKLDEIKVLLEDI